MKTTIFIKNVIFWIFFTNAIAIAGTEKNNQTVALKVVIKGSSGNTVTSNPIGINCGANCIKSYDPGTSVLLIATPGKDSTHSIWDGCSKTIDGKCLVIMDKNKEIKAIFTNTVTPEQAQKNLQLGQARKEELELLLKKRVADDEAAKKRRLEEEAKKRDEIAKRRAKEKADREAATIAYKQWKIEQLKLKQLEIELEAKKIQQSIITEVHDVEEVEQIQEVQEKDAQQPHDLNHDFNQMLQNLPDTVKPIKPDVERPPTIQKPVLPDLANPVPMPKPVPDLESIKKLNSIDQ